MTKLLEKAFEEASKLPEEDQDALAEMLLVDLSSEERWISPGLRTSLHSLRGKLGPNLNEVRRG